MIDLVFNRDYQCRLLVNMVRSSKLFGQLSADIHLNDFDLGGCRLIYEIVRSYYEKQKGTVPPFSTIELEVLRVLQGNDTQYETLVQPDEVESVANILGMIAGTPESQLDPSYFVASIREFLMNTRLLSIESQGLPADQKIAKIIKENELLNRVGNTALVFHNAMTKVEPLQGSDQERYGTGMLKIDRLLNGGICRRQHGVVIAGTGVGKTNFFLNCHVWAAVHNFMSLDIALEMELWMLRERFQAMMAHIDAGWFQAPNDPRFDPASAWRHSIAISPDFRYNDKFDVIDYSATYITLEQVRESIIAWKEHCYKKGHDVDKECCLVTLDYADKLLHDGLPGVTKNTNDSDKLTKISEGLANIGRQQNVAIWTASQITKNAVGREVLDVRHAAHCYHRSDATDIALGIAPIEQAAIQDGYGNDDARVQGVTCDRQLNCSVMKARGTAAAGISEQTYQGATLKYWGHRDNFILASRELRNKQDPDTLYAVIRNAIARDRK